MGEMKDKGAKKLGYWNENRWSDGAWNLKGKNIYNKNHKEVNSGYICILRFLDIF